MMSVVARVVRVTSVDGVETDRRVWVDRFDSVGVGCIVLNGGFVHIGTAVYESTSMVTTFTVSGTSGELRKAAQLADARVAKSRVPELVAPIAAVVREAADRTAEFEGWQIRAGVI